MTAIDLVSWLAVVVTALWALLAKDPTDSPEAPPLRLIDGGRPLALDLPTARQATDENRATGSGIPHPERLRLERL